MEPCPYCGSSVRSGARFCTSCGRRLTPAAGDAPPITESAAAGTPVGAAPAAWETAAAAAERPGGGEDWLKRSPIASADLWPSATRSDEAPPTRAAAADEEEAPVDGDADGPRYGVAPEPDAVVWPSSPWSGWAAPETESEQHGGEAHEAASIGVEEAADTASGEPWPAVDTAVPEMVEQPAQQMAAGPEVSAAPPVAAGDALTRALGLVDELRGLLPAVAGASGVDLAAAVSVLTTARDDASGLDGEALGRAEAAVAAARERPREIDALLGLSGNLDALAEVLAARTRYAAAVEQAIGLLGGGSGVGSGDAASEGAED